MKKIGPTFLIRFIALLSVTAFAESPHNTVPGDYPAVELLTTDTDILGRILAYPNCKPLITSSIITIAPGQTGKTHQHKTPLYSYMLSGKINVTYNDTAKTTNTYAAGESIMEAMYIDHHGFNPFDEPASLLAVYMDCEANEDSDAEVKEATSPRT